MLGATGSRQGVFYQAGAIALCFVFVIGGGNAWAQQSGPELTREQISPQEQIETRPPAPSDADAQISTEADQDAPSQALDPGSTFAFTLPLLKDHKSLHIRANPVESSVRNVTLRKEF